MAPTHPRKSPIPLEKRTWSGKVIDVEPSVVHLLLKDCPWAATARVLVEDLPASHPVGVIKEGQILPVFLTHPSLDDPKMWFASARWAIPEQNPWLTDPPRVGEKRYGTAIQYVRDFAVFVRLDNGIDAFLHVEELPGIHRSIHESVHIGDGIGGEVVEVRPNLLEVKLDVAKLLAREEKEEGFRRNREVASTAPKEEKRATSALPVSGSLEDNAVVAPKLSSVNLAIIDDDNYFVASLQRWLGSMGITSRRIGSQQALKKALLGQGGLPTHILLDYHLGPDWDAAATQRLVANSAIPALMVSGAGEAARGRAKHNRLPFLPKPFLIKDLVDWLATGQVRESEPEAAAPDEDQHISQHWFDSRPARQVQVRGHRLLKELCEQTECLAAIWFRRERPHVYRPRVWHGVEETSFAALNRIVHQSAVASVIEQDAETEEAVDRAGPLFGPAPGRARYLWAFPLPVEDSVSRCLVFYRANSFDAACKQRIRDYLPRMEDLAERLGLVQRLEEAEVFAAIGRAKTGLVHELKGAAAPLAATLEDLLDHTLTAEQIRPILRDIHHDVKRIISIARSNLDLIRQERPERLSVRVTCEQIISLMLIQANEIGCKLGLCAPEREVITSLPPQVLEQALINLLDNALYHLKTSGRRWGHIVIKIWIVSTDLKTPIRIEVRDNGPGMNAEELEQAFVPRVTDKGREGSGMGLFISRALLREVGGELSVEESIRWLGSRLLIRLPVRLGTMLERVRHE